MRVGEIMSTPVRTVSPDETAVAAWEKMRLFRIRHIVVERDGRVVGVLSDRDLGGAHGERFRTGRRVADLMTEKVVVASPETSVREAANLMRGHAIDCLPVVEGDTVKGIVTALDLLELIGRGAERPIAASTRRVLKHRGQKPRGQTAAKHRARAKHVVSR